jgi:hypothetical protein
MLFLLVTQVFVHSPSTKVSLGILGRFSQQSLVVLDRVFLTDKGFAEDIESRLNRFFGFHENSSENKNLTLIYHRDYREH